jgi:hypothetical protein
MKTRPTEQSVESFLNAVPDATRRRDCLTVLEIMRRVTGEQPRMWGPGMVGFGSYHYRYESGREGDWFLAGFSPRKNDLTIYIVAGFDRFEALMDRLGKYRIGKSCLYVKRLDDVDLGVLEELVSVSVTHVREVYGTQ